MKHGPNMGFILTKHGMCPKFMGMFDGALCVIVNQLHEIGLLKNGLDNPVYGDVHVETQINRPNSGQKAVVTCTERRQETRRTASGTAGRLDRPIESIRSTPIACSYLGQIISGLHCYSHKNTSSLTRQRQASP